MSLSFHFFFLFLITEVSNVENKILPRAFQSRSEPFKNYFSIEILEAQKKSTLYKDQIDKSEYKFTDSKTLASEITPKNSVANSDGLNGLENDWQKPPQLKTSFKIPFPIQALEQGLSGHVIANLTLDENGKIQDAQVVSSNRDDFKKAFLNNFQKFEFSPAEKNGKTISSRIKFTYRFELD